MITPINGHVLIEPMVQDSFIATDHTTYQEIGIVIDADDQFTEIQGTSYRTANLSKGDKVYFDSWLAAKFPKDRDTFYWLVKYEDIRAVEYAVKE